MDAFWSGVIANSLGSAVGVGLALFNDRRRERARRQAEAHQRAQARDRDEASHLRTCLWLVEENKELAAQATATLKNKGLFFFEMNTHLLDSSLLRLSALCEEPDLLWHLEHFRYQLHHVNAKIRAWSQAAIFQGIPTQDAHTLLDKSVVPSIIKHIDDLIIPAAEELVPKLRSRWQIVSPTQQAPVRPHLVMPG